MNDSAFTKHIKSAGSMSRTNPELERLHIRTGFSIEWLFKVASGQKTPSVRMVKAVLPHVKGLDESSFQAQEVRGERGRVAAEGRRRRTG